MKKCSKILPLLIVVLSIIVSGCGRPSNKVIEEAIREHLGKQGRNARVEDVRVIKVGTAQASGSKKRWPVKVYVKGIYGEKTWIWRYKGEVFLDVFKDPFGTWRAEGDLYDIRGFQKGLTVRRLNRD